MLGLRNVSSYKATNSLTLNELLVNTAPLCLTASSHIIQYNKNSERHMSLSESEALMAMTRQVHVLCQIKTLRVCL